MKKYKVEVLMLTGTPARAIYNIEADHWIIGKGAILFFKSPPGAGLKAFAIYPVKYTIVTEQ